MVTLADKYAILGQHAQADMMRAQAEQDRAAAQNQLAREQAAIIRPGFQDTQRMNAAKIGQMDYENAKMRAETGRIGMLAPAERYKTMAEGDYAGAHTARTYGLLPYEQQESASRTGLNNSQSYAARTQAYYNPLWGEHANRPLTGGGTPTDPRSIGYDGGGGGRVLNAGMAAPGGTYAPGPRTVSAPPPASSYPVPGNGPLPDEQGYYYDSVGRRYPSTTPAPKIAPARSRARGGMVGSDAFGDDDPSLQLPKPPGIADISRLASPGFNERFATRGLGGRTTPDYNQRRVNAGLGIFQAPSASFTGMAGRDSDIGLGSQKDPNTGEAFGSIYQRPGDFWENPADRRY